MQSSKFGPPAWDTMFTFAFGYYLNPLPCDIKDPNYIQFFKLFGKVLPCKYCRDSYTDFFESLPIKEYLKQDYGLVRFVYDLKNLVNHKLESQEEKALYKEYTLLKASSDIDTPLFWEKFRKQAHKICYTKPAPSFISVLENLKKQRADCSSIEKHCRTPLQESQPQPQQQQKSLFDQNDSILRNIVGGKRRKRVSRKVSKKVSRRKRVSSKKRRSNRRRY
jgi:thioredoxin-related protein